MSKVPITAAGYAALDNELRHRIRVERPRVIERVQKAIADDTNLAENSEYQAATADQEINEARIAVLEDLLARADIIDVSKLSGDTVKFGCTVTVIDADSDEERVWQIVGQPEADAAHGKISVNAPLARALIGKASGDFVEVDAPGGGKAYMIVKVMWA